MSNAADVAKDKKQAEEIARRFGQNLRRARKRAAMSQEELAVGASLHRTEIGLIERGHQPVGLQLALSSGVHCVYLRRSHSPCRNQKSYP